MENSENDFQGNYYKKKSLKYGAIFGAVAAGASAYFAHKLGLPGLEAAVVDSVSFILGAAGPLFYGIVKDFQYAFNSLEEHSRRSEEEKKFSELESHATKEDLESLSEESEEKRTDAQMTYMYEQIIENLPEERRYDLAIKIPDELKKVKLSQAIQPQQGFLNLDLPIMGYSFFPDIRRAELFHRLLIDYNSKGS